MVKVTSEWQQVTDTQAVAIADSRNGPEDWFSLERPRKRRPGEPARCYALAGWGRPGAVIIRMEVDPPKRCDVRLARPSDLEDLRYSEPE